MKRRTSLTLFLPVVGLLLAGCSRPAAQSTQLLADIAADGVAVAPETAAPATPAPAAAANPAPDPAAAAPPADSDVAKARAAFETVARVLGRAGVYKTADVYVVTVPRDDLALAIDGMAVPTAAGIESVFSFYYCPCGKTNVVGQFCVLDYEQNDVIDALRAARIEVVSVAPMLLHTRNAPVAIRFFAESKPEPLAAAIREALRWTGRERMAPAGPANAK